MTTDDRCSFCATSKPSSKLVKLSGPKATQLQFSKIILSVFNINPNPTHLICSSCIGIIQKCDKIKTTYLESLYQSGNEFQHVTPKRRKVSVAEKIVLSLEKLKNKTPFEYKNQNCEKPVKARKRLFDDHQYYKNAASTDTVVDTCDSFHLCSSSNSTNDRNDNSTDSTHTSVHTGDSFHPCRTSNSNENSTNTITSQVSDLPDHTLPVDNSNFQNGNPFTNKNSDEEKRKEDDVVNGIVLRVMGNVKVADGLKKHMVYQLQASLSKLSFKGNSVLFEKDVKTLSKGKLNQNIIQEMKEKSPFLFDILDSCVGSAGSKEATIATIYGMIMHSRNKQASAIQRVLTVLAIKCHADNKLLSRFNKMHITMSAESKRQIIKESSQYNEKRLVEAISKGLNGKINGDNIDIYVHTNDIRMKNTNNDYHFFASDWTPYRIIEDDFLTNEYLFNRTIVNSRPDINVDLFTLQNEDVALLRSSLKILVGRILYENCQEFKWLKNILPKHISHPLTMEMRRKTTSYQLPILLENETKYDDCIHIMDSYLRWIEDWYTQAGRGNEFERLKVPVGGDQLTRIRLEGAKSLRAGAHLPSERFDCLQPMIVELFHTLMDFVEKVFKKFMKKNSGRDIGTLGNLKVLIQRSSVNGNVKSRYKTHEEFLLLIGKSYLLESAMTFFGMEDLDACVTLNCPPDNVGTLHKTKRQASFDIILDKFLDFVQGPANFQEEQASREINLRIGDAILPAHVNADNEVTLNVTVGENMYEVTQSVKSMQDGKMINILLPGSTGNSLKISKADSDDMLNYASYLINVYLIVISLKDAIAEGDIIRINVLLKSMIPFFYASSCLSKYLVECLDYILKTEVLLTQKEAVLVQTSSFLNPTGRPGHNKPADLEKENQIKELKTLIKGLGSNKTEKSIVDISKAASVLNGIVSHFDNQINFENFSTRHKSRSEIDDLHVLCKKLRNIKPFLFKHDRKLDSYRNFPNNVYEELRSKKALFHGDIMSIVTRLQRNMPVMVEDEEDMFSNSFDED